MSNDLPPKAATPGWNDPPQVPFDPSKSQGAASRRGKLNKRVAFPIQATAQPTQSFSPIVATEADNAETIGTLLCSAEELKISHENCSKVIKNFTECLDRSGCDRDMKYDLKMRIKCFEAQWKENKLPEELRTTVLKLSEALVERNDEEAETLLAHAVENFYNMTSSWMPVVRHILTEASLDTEAEKEC